MSLKLKTYSREELTAGIASLPAELAFLSKAKCKYFLITQRKVGRKIVWHVEIEASMLKSLQKKNTSLSKLRVKYSALEKSCESIVSENKGLSDKNAWLTEYYEKTMKNISEDERPDKFHKSPKSHLAVFNERGFKLSTNLPFQGGLAGL